MGKHGQHEDEGVILLRNAFLHVPKYSASRPTPPSAKWSCNIFETDSDRMQSNGGKVKTKFTIQQAMKAWRGGGEISTISLTSELGGVGEERRALVALRPGKTLGTLCIGGGRSAGMDVCGKSRPHRDSIPGPTIPYWNNGGHHSLGRMLWTGQRPCKLFCWQPKLKMSLCLITYHATETYGEWRYSPTHS